MDKVAFIKEIKDWVNGDPFREARLIVETPIKPSTLVQLKAGTYTPSDRMVNALRAVMAKYPPKGDSGPEAA